MSSTPHHRLKVTILLTRLPTITESTFHAHWTNQHAKIVSPWLQKHGVIKYTQVRQTQSHTPKSIHVSCKAIVWVTSASQFHIPSTAQRQAQESISVLPKEKYETSYDGAVELILRDERSFEEARKGESGLSVDRRVVGISVDWCSEMIQIRIMNKSSSPTRRNSSTRLKVG